MNTGKYRTGMEITVQTEGNAPYKICLQDSFRKLSDYVKALGCEGHRICIVTDSNVGPLYLETVKQTIKDCCTTLASYEIPAGEESKTLDHVKELYEVLIQAGFDRHDYLLALGGGVVGDLTGFAAATYLRGIRFIQVPTTLLSQIDSSIGGKTGVDFDSYKNMVGAFHQPALVYINIKTLHTLPDDQFASGMGELLKHGLILDADYYEWTLDHMSDIEDRKFSILLIMVARSCELKKYVVEKDPKETTGDRALLNFGHTIGHAIEKLKNFELLHGECVALGTVAAAYISWKRGMIEEDEFYEIRDMNVGFYLPISFEGPTAGEIIAATKKDKKMDAGKIRFVLLEKPGHAVVVSDVTDAEMEEAINFIRYDGDSLGTGYED
ncbi:MAG: 3-dehydroquinate synthase [Lachnospiraceae bacterium]|nr:3-dehydroquinate synthase [Lachnospiraceae bacterium]